ESIFFSSRRRHTRCLSDWSSDVCSSDLAAQRDLVDKQAALATGTGGAGIRAGHDHADKRISFTKRLDRCDGLGGRGCCGRLCLRSEEHTSELQSLRHLVCRLLLEKNKRP